jgi:threonine aldolase
MTAEINLYSDTVTKPTPGMYRAICEAELGDDMSGEDPSVNLLEARMAEWFGKEAAVLGCSGTQTNQMGLRAHCDPGDELLIERTGHIANYEAGSPAVLSGITCRTLIGEAGMLDVPVVEGMIRANDQHLCRTRLLCVENTTNLGGGRAYPLAQLQRLKQWAAGNNLKVHMDGARFFNALAAKGYSAREVADCLDTVSLCFSKGLGCPMGSILIGSREEIARARRARKQFGGALRQAGIIAGAALYALDHHVDRLNEDHANARLFAERIAGIEGLKINLEDVETNLVFFEIDPEIGTADDLAARMKTRGVRLGALGRHLLRGCTHLDVSREQVLEAANRLAECIEAWHSERTDRAVDVSGAYRSDW